MQRNPGRVLQHGICLLGLLLSNKLYATMGLTVAPDFGYQTNVPITASDSAFKNRAFTMISLAPCFTHEGRYLELEFSCPFEAGDYFGGPIELSAEPGLSFIKKGPAHSTKFGLKAQYYSMPAVYDPTVPDTYWKFAASLEWKNGIKNSLTANYEFAIVNDPASQRVDAKNSLSFKASPKFGSSIVSNLKLGMVWDISDAEGYGFLEPLGSLGSTVLLNGNDFIFFQVYAALVLLQKPEISTSTDQEGSNKNKKSSDTTVHRSNIPIFMISSGYCKGIAPKVDLNINYSFMVIAAGNSQSRYSSHRLSVGIEWSFGNKL